MLYFRHMRGGQSTSGRSLSPWGARRRFFGGLRKSENKGFTLIEVLIVLAVTGLLFVSAVIMISGRHTRTAFEQSSRQIQSQIQQTINEVSAGFYPDMRNFGCTAGADAPMFSAAGAGQGTNSGCIFLGRAMQFGVGAADSEQFAIYTIAGLQKNPSGNEASSLAEAKPMAVAPSTLHPGYPDNSVDEALQSGLRPVRMWYNNGGGDVEIGAVAFVSSLAEYGFSGDIVSGAGRVNVVAIGSTSLGSSKTAVVDAINSDSGNGVANGAINPSGGVYVCFEGGTDDYALVQIGGDKRDLSVELMIVDKGDSPCDA